MRSFGAVPHVHRLILYVSGWFAPPSARPLWRSNHLRALRNLWVLLERGELPASGTALAAGYCRGVLHEAFFLGRGQTGWAGLLGSPAFAGLLALSVLSVTVVLSGGLASSRLLIRLAQRSCVDQVFGHAFILVLATLSGVPLLWSGTRSMHWHGSRYALFFVLKMALIATMLTLVWIEGSAGIHASLAFSRGLQIASRLALAFGFLVAFGVAIQWGVEDQKRRCPHCLQRLDLAISLGSWASVFDPPTSGLVCPAGHGSLALPERPAASGECWTAFDESWREMFMRT